MNVGVAGLGAMGKAMAANLVKAGHTVTVWNRSPAPAAELAAILRVQLLFGTMGIAPPRVDQT
jgi:3-hydroxyisobutyrate dehydrogenase-like beta-hydroxyacid dehydrogenase